MYNTLAIEFISVIENCTDDQRTISQMTLRSRESPFSPVTHQPSPCPREAASFVDSIAIIFTSGARIEARAALPRDGSRESSSCWSRVVACALLFSPLARVSRRGSTRRVVPGHRVQVCSLSERGVPSRARARALAHVRSRSSLARRAPLLGPAGVKRHRTCAGPNRPPDLWERSGPRASHDTPRLLLAGRARGLQGSAHRAPRSPPSPSCGAQDDGGTGGAPRGI